MGNLVQVLVDTSLTVTETFQVDGAPINVDSGLPTVALTRPDGTAFTPLPTVLDTWAGPPARTTGQYRFVLDAQPEVTWLDYELTGTIGGKTQKLKGRVEWVGALLFTLSAMRGLRVGDGYPFATDATPLFSNEQLMEARTAVLDEFGDHLGFSPVPRFRRETHSLRAGVVLLDKLLPTRLLSVTVAGVAQATSGYYLDGVQVLPVSAYTLGTWGGYGYGDATIEYEHGWERVRGKGSHMAMLYAAAILQPGGFSSASTVTTPDGVSYTYEPSEVGRDGFQRFTGIKAVDRWLNDHKQVSAAVA
jgi:hypothetical protein